MGQDMMNLGRDDGNRYTNEQINYLVNDDTSSLHPSRYSKTHFLFGGDEFYLIHWIPTLFLYLSPLSLCLVFLVVDSLFSFYLSLPLFCFVLLCSNLLGTPILGISCSC
ncbi:hypothetical protein F4823DRAFT_158078 [Ustulina deusta]|nr:hypothetical protein F4823DRAFT_158078 [Ustulina deusta]